MRTICLVVSAGLGLIDTSASAQAVNPPENAPQAAVTEAAEPQSVVVKGVRQSLQSAVQKKRLSEVISDTISAEDMGKFPDQNLAESLQHITGVQITRSNGEGQNVSVRGIDPQFNRVLLNGRAITSPSGDRSFNFANLSSDFVSTLEVYKSPSADMEEGGLAGTVNVITAKPLDIRKRKIVANVEGAYDSNAGKTTPHVSLLYNDVSADQTWGVTLGGDFGRKSLSTQKYEAFGLEQRQISALAPVVNGGSGGSRSDVVGFNHAANFGMVEGNTERQNYLATVQYKPNSALDVRFNVLYSKYDTDGTYPVNSQRFTNIAGPNAAVVDYVNNNGILTYLDANGVDQRNNSRDQKTLETIFSPALSATYRTGDWRFNGELSSSNAARTANSLALEVIGRANVSEDLRQHPGELPTVVYSRGYNPLDASGYVVLGANGDYQRKNSENNRAARFDVKYNADWGVVSSIEAGLRYSTNKEDVGSSHFSVGAEQLAGALGATYNPNIEGGSFNAAPYMRLHQSSNFLSGVSGAAPTSWLASDLNLLLAKLPLDKMLALSPPTANLASVYQVEETTTAGYGKLNFDAADGRFTGNLGVRVVKTEQLSSGYAPDLSKIVFSQQGATTTIPNVTATSVRRTYTNVLPSLNTRFELTKDLVARASMAKVMSRPNLGLLAPNTNVNANVKTISGGNPDLKPYMANQFDLSLEWYLPKGGLASGALFEKDIKNFVVSTSSSQNLTVNLAEGGSTTQTFTVLRPGNGGDSKLRGVELGYQQPFTFLPAPFDKFGAIANYTYVDAAPTRVVENGPLIPLPGVSKHNYNLIAYYEDDVFGARLSYNYRDRFVVDSSSYFGDGQFTQPFKQLDMSMTYKINKSVDLALHALNLGNNALVNVDKYGINRGVEVTGRRYSLGLHIAY